MKQYLITPNAGYLPGSMQILLQKIGCGPMLENPDRTIRVALTDQQYNRFLEIGSAHQIREIAVTPASFDQERFA